MATASPGKPVANPSDIEKELVRIWREAAQADASHDAATGEPAPRMRASLSNIILLTDANSPPLQSSRVEGLITELCITHPSRFFIVRLDAAKTTASGAPLLDTAVSSRCVLANSGAHVCSEEVYITTGPSGVSVVPNLLTSLLVADVQVILIVLCDPVRTKSAGAPTLAQTLVKGVSKLCDRIIFDSELFSNYGEDLNSLLSMGAFASFDPESGAAGAVVVVDGAHAVSIRDVNWQRLKRWRMLIAEQFSNKRFRQVTEKITQLEIDCEGLPAEGGAIVLSSDALLLSAWFAAALGWRAIRSTSDGPVLKIAYETADKKPVSILLRIQQPQTGTPNDSLIQRILIIVDDGGRETQMQMQYRRAESSVEIVTGSSGATSGASDSETLSRKTAFPVLPFDRLILADVVGGQSDADFASALAESRVLSGIVRG